MSEDERTAFTEAARPEEGERRLILRTFLRAGAYDSELINFRVEDVSLAEGHLTIRNPRGSVFRQVPLVEPLLTKLRDHIGARDFGLLFEGLGGERLNADQVFSSSGVELLLSRSQHS